MSLDLTIQGDAPGIKGVGDWLADSLASAANDADLELAYLVGDAVTLWTGESGTAFNSTAQAARRATFCVPTFVKDLADVMRAYAARLERGQDYFDEVLQYAKDGGLRVSGTIIHPPQSTLNYCPGPGSPSEDLDEYDSYIKKLELYNQLGTDVGTWEGELDVWIYENFGGLGAGVEDMVEAASVLSALRSHDAEFIDMVLETASARNKRDLTDWRTASQEFADEYEEYKSNKRSGHPARQAAAQEAIPEDIRSAKANADFQVEKLAKAARIIPGIGYVIDAGMGIYEINEGGSPSSVGVEILAGAGGGAAAGAGAVALGGPVVWVAGAVVAGGYVVGKGGVWLWETVVPLDSREGLDDFILDGVDTLIFWDDHPRIPR